MPTLREECMEVLANDLDSYVEYYADNKSVEDIYNGFLEFQNDMDHNFWTINHDEDEMSQQDFMSLIQICAQTNLYPPGWVDTGGPGASHGHMDRMLKHYYIHICIETKVWICQLIQDKLNKV